MSERRVLIAIPLVIAFLAGVGAIVAPFGGSLVILAVFALFAAQMAREHCPRGQQEHIEILFRRARRRDRWRRLRAKLRGVCG